MNAPTLHVAVPEGTPAYWSGLLTRSGLVVRRLREANGPGATLFLPEAAGTESPVLRRTVERALRAGEPILAGPAWGRALGRPLPAGPRLGFATTALGCAVPRPAEPCLVLPLPTAAELLRPSARMSALTGAPGSPPLAPQEVIAVADHGGLRRAVEAALRALAFAAGRPFARLQHAPAGYTNTLAIRIDADSFRRDATAGLRAALAKAGQRATWFIDVERHQLYGGLDTLARLAADGHELQSHGHRHYTYRSAWRNERNLRRSLQGLARVGVHATAAAAPFGTWNHGFERALRRTDLAWSTEFSRNHDDVPGALGGTADEPWQVPVHPVCPALLFAAGADVQQVTDWFVAEFTACSRRGEPAVFYGHPIDDLDRCPDLLPELVAAARAAGSEPWRPTLGELHDFYRRRARQHVELRWQGDRLSGAVDGPAPLLVERRGLPNLVVTGACSVPTTTPAGDDRLPQPLTYRPRIVRRDAWRTRRLQLARLVRELRR